MTEMTGKMKIVVSAISMIMRKNGAIAAHVAQAFLESAAPLLFFLRGPLGARWQQKHAR